MPPQFLFDLSQIDLNKVLFDQEVVREMIPQRGDMEMLNGIIWSKPEDGQILGYKDIRPDEFWVPGHIPGRPLFPGVLMIELGAQLASFYTRKYVGWKGFIGFGGVDEVKFRNQVNPGCRMLILGQKIWERHKRIACKVQGVVDGSLAMEATITGVEF
jgi:3-hydroxyacyl-[acyl-carrier-protein] dehydratase